MVRPTFSFDLYRGLWSVEAAAAARVTGDTERGSRDAPLHLHRWCRKPEGANRQWEASTVAEGAAGGTSWKRGFRWRCELISGSGWISVRISIVVAGGGGGAGGYCGSSRWRGWRKLEWLNQRRQRVREAEVVGEPRPLVVARDIPMVVPPLAQAVSVRVVRVAPAGTQVAAAEAADGWYGGGGGGGDDDDCCADGGGGGGGSSYASTSNTQNVEHQIGVNSGHGRLVITYSLAPVVR